MRALGSQTSSLLALCTEFVVLRNFRSDLANSRDTRGVGGSVSIDDPGATLRALGGESERVTALAVGRVCFIETAHSCPRARRLSAFHPLSVILSLTIVTGVLHPLRSVFAVTSPARIKPVSDASENPCASIIASLRPSGLPVRKASARYWSAVKGGMGRFYPARFRSGKRLLQVRIRAMS